MTAPSRDATRAIGRPGLAFLTFTMIALCATQGMAHNVTEGEAGYIQEMWGASRRMAALRPSCRRQA